MISSETSSRRGSETMRFRAMLGEIVALLIIFAGAALTTEKAYAITTQDGWEYSVSDQGASGKSITITGYSGQEKQLTLPSTIDGIPVTVANLDYGHTVESLDASQCSSLTYLNIYTGTLSNLNVAGLSALQGLTCQSNELTALDISGCTSLQSVSCRFNYIKDTTALEAWVNSAEQSSSHYGAILPQYDSETGFAYQVSDGLGPAANYGHGAYVTGWDGRSSQVSIPAQLGGADVVYVQITNRALTALDISQCSSLKFLDCMWNYISDTTSLDAWLAQAGRSGFVTPQYDRDMGFAYEIRDGEYGYGVYISNYDYFHRSDSVISIPAEIDGQPVVSIASPGVRCDVLNLAQCGYLKAVSLYYGQTKAIVAPSSSSLETFLCEKNNTYTIDINDCPSLKSFSCDENYLTSLDLSGCGALTSLKCSRNNLSTLDLSKFPNLQTLNCQSNILTSLDISPCNNLSSLVCVRNLLSDTSSLEAWAQVAGHNAVITPQSSAPTGVAGITLDQSRIELNGAESKQLVAAVQPAGQEANLVWSSSDESIATVDQSGVVTAKAHGAAVISVETADHAFRTSCLAVVINSPAAVTLSPEKLTMKVGETSLVVPTITGVLPGEVSDYNIGWMLSNEGVVKITPDYPNGCKIEALAEGTVTVTGVATGGVKATCEITVAGTGEATNVTISGAVPSVSVGETVQLSAAVEPANSTDKVVWSSSDEAVLKVDQNGLVTVIGNGSATISATADTAVATAVMQASTPVSGVMLDATNLDLYVGAEPSALKATVAPATASNQAVTWASSDELVATVDAQGNVAPVAPGSATITVTTEDGGFTATCNVTVSQHATGVALDKHDATIVGAKTVALKVTVAPDNATNTGVSWVSSNTAVATVDAGGMVTAVGKGAATITATTEDGGYQDTCSVTVLNPIVRVTLDQPTLSLTKGETATVVPIYEGELPGSVDDPDTTSWSSSDESVATVENGVVTALKTGSATVTFSVSTAGNVVGVETTTISVASSVTVTNPVRAITLSETSKSGEVGTLNSFKLTATIEPADADDLTPEWSSSNASVATVDSTGNVTIRHAGSAVITATAGSQSAQCAVDIAEKQIAATTPNSVVSGSVSVADADSASDPEFVEKVEGLSLVVEQASTEAAPVEQATSTLATQGLSLAGVFDIHFVDAAGEEQAWDDAAHTLTVRLQMTDAMRALSDLTVYYIDDNGNRTAMPTRVEGGYIVFETTHFSTYAVAGKEVPIEQAGGGVSAGTTTPLAPPCGSQLAATGDATGSFVGMVALLVVAGLALSIIAGARIRRNH